MMDEGTRVIVLTGEGRHFCSGGDITSFTGMTPTAGRVRMQRLHRTVRLMITGEKPLIAAVEGAAFGAGLSVAAACDIVVASEDAKFGCPFSKFGLVPDWGALWSLPHRMGMGRAKMFMLSGRTLDARTAEQQGLVELVVSAGAALEQALVLANEIAASAPLSHAMVKSVLARGADNLNDVLAAEADAQGVLYSTEDFVEGQAAFLAKRTPNFKGR
jgi:2-(1,2-epoxy-1,2-dihydrophenyl)acetyl-CoA isomerase